MDRGTGWSIASDYSAAGMDRSTLRSRHPARMEKAPKSCRRRGSSMGASGRADGQGVGRHREAGADDDPGGRARRGEPWLERTQWLPYLVGMERPDLLACIEEPVAEPDARQEQQAEPVEAAIWAAMDGLARFSQASIIDRIGVFIRLEAIRTEMHQTRFQPLQRIWTRTPLSSTHDRGSRC
ncbi:hypothetical protein A1F99_122460 [Pyrenophora tritici-repentis]|nr:hypothetical protein A1F99_122460 [Pyrenophora tritici-repentis]